MAISLTVKANQADVIHNNAGGKKKTTVGYLRFSGFLNRFQYELNHICRNTYNPEEFQQMFMEHISKTNLQISFNGVGDISYWAMEGYLLGSETSGFRGLWDTSANKFGWLNK